MVEELNTEDYVTIGIYFVVVLAVGLWVSNYCLCVDIMCSSLFAFHILHKKRTLSKVLWVKKLLLNVLFPMSCPRIKMIVSVLLQSCFTFQTYAYAI